MQELKIIECSGFTKEEAFKDLKFDPNVVAIPGVNITSAWFRAGKPNVNTVDFKRFLVDQLEKKTKNKPGLGVHLVLEPPVKDIRTRPYTVINNKATATRDWKISYEIREDELNLNYISEPIIDDYGEVTDETSESMEISIVRPGQVVEICDNKADALNKMKELITSTHKCYSVLIKKVPNIAPVAAFGFYTPSSGAKKGLFLACGFEKEDA